MGSCEWGAKRDGPGGAHRDDGEGVGWDRWWYMVTIGDNGVLRTLVWTGKTSASRARERERGWKAGKLEVGSSLTVQTTWSLAVYLSRVEVRPSVCLSVCLS